MLVGLDCTWLVRRAYSVNPTHCVSTVIGWVCRYSQELKATHIVAGVDTGRSFRKDIDSEYKSNRTAGRSEVHDYIDDFMDRLPKLGIHLQPSDGFETDDVLATIGHQAKKSVLVTPDKDNLQGVSEKCSIYIPPVGGRPEKLITIENFKQFSGGLTPAQFLDWQTLAGDSTDAIPKIMQPAASRKLILKYGSLRNYFDTKEGSAWAKVNKERLKLNRKLVKLDTSCFDVNMKAYRRPAVHTGAEPQNKWYQQLVSNTNSLF